MRSLDDWACKVLALMLVSVIPAFAEDISLESHTPSLGDLMAVVQVRHSKLWYAGNLRNWPLADYELQQLDATLKQATRTYPNTPPSDLATTQRLTGLIGESIKAEDRAKFQQVFAQMTVECNNCHTAAGRAFILIRKPAFPSPYSNQSFAPSKR
jgi:hypothetical protein